MPEDMLRGPYEGKYKKLYEHLQLLGDSSATMTFEQIEYVLGFSLPKSARHHQAWWANQPRGQSLAWVRAGFRTASVFVDEERLTFLRSDVAGPDGEATPPARESLPNLTISEAKERLARTFGVDPSQIEITIRA